MLIDIIVAFNLVLTLYCVYMTASEAKTISFILDWIIEHDTKEGKNNDETA